MRKTVRFLFVVASVFAAYAQFDQGQISGTIKDASQAVVIAAGVTATSADTGQTVPAVPDQNGSYLFTNLRVGTYEVTVHAPGFKAYKKTNVRVDAAARTTVDVVLEVGATTESIEVTANTTMVTLETAQIGRTIDSSQIMNLALNGRDPLNMAVLKAGVIGDQFNGFNPGWVEQSVSIAGGRKNGNAVTVDGVNTLRARGDATRDTNIGQPNVDSIEEVQILTSTYPAEYGRAMDGQVRFVTKSGTRDFHGTAWEFFRNSRLDANSWVRNSSPKQSDYSRPAPFRFNQPGYSIGGPVVIPGKFNTDRKKLFFFATQEFMWYRKEQTNTSTVPTAAMRIGDFSGLLDPTNPFFRKVRIVNDPTTGKPFPNNVIPTNQLSPNGTAILGAYPLPTPGYQVGTTNWIKTLPNPITTRKDMFHVDYYTGKSRISFMGNHFSYAEDQPFEGTFGTGLDLSNTRWHRPNQMAVLSINTTLSATKVNDITISGASDRAQLDPYVNGGVDKLQRTQYGINFPYIIPGQKSVPDRIPAAAIAGLFTLNGGTRPQNSSGPIYSWTDNFTWIARSNHTLKFGGFLEKVTAKNNEQTGSQNGSFSFLDAGANPLTTGVAIANAAMGTYDSYSEAGPRPYTLATSWAVESYAQDTWKVKPNLTVEMGVRWSYRQPFHPKWNDLANFEPAFYNPANVAIVDRTLGFIVSGDPYNGIVLPGNGIPDSAKGRANAIKLPNYQRLFHNLPGGFVNSYHDAFAPRLGIAYRLSGKTGVRMGGGIFHQRQMLQSLFSNPPNLVSLTTGFGQVDNPGGAGAHTFPFSVSALDLNYKYPTAYSYSFSLQHELPGGAVLDVAYVGKTSVHLLRTRNLNQMAPGTLQANPGVQTNALRPYMGLASINYTTTDGRSKYNSLQVSLDRRFRSGLGFGVSYTFSKTRDNIGWLGAAAYTNQYFVTAPFEWDRPHTLNANVVYELPFLRSRRGMTANLLGGWQVSSVIFFRSGNPLSVLDAVDVAGTGQGNAPWNLVGSPDVSGPRGINQLWFNPAAFALPKAGTFGNAGLGIIRGPRFQNLDASLFKKFRLYERLTGELRLEAFNVANHPLMGDPVTDPRSGDFGYIRSKSLVSTQANVSTNERNTQLGLKFIF